MNKIVDVEGMRKHAPTRGVWGHAPPENFLKMNALRLNLGLSGGIFTHFKVLNVHPWKF